MVTEVVDRKENQYNSGKLEVNQLEAWKAIGSPARRASINPETAELNELAANMAARARAASISSMGLSAEGPPPGFAPGLVAEGQEWKSHSPKMWNNGGLPDFDSNDEFRDMASRISKEAQQADDLTEEEYLAIPKGRSRSKSSSAIFGSLDEDPFDPKTMPDMSSIWGPAKRPNPLHRRASTQPSQETLMWEALRASQLATPNDMNGANTDQLMERFRMEYMGQSRRLSVAPSMVQRFMAQNVDVEEDFPSAVGGRRHSLAGPFDRALNFEMNNSFKDMQLSEQLEKIDDYFENTESRTKAFKEAGKSLQQATSDESSTEPSTSYHWPLYVIEFKAGRTDYFYLPEDVKDLNLKIGDLAIVEADRGKDLGKIIEVGILNMTQLQQYQASHVDPLVDSHNAVGKEIQPKKIYRLAEPDEVAMLISKSEDEEKANALCQSKIRQKKLPMEIVDAEYQWDRRKLTFYFVADRRIDFRELVRELFKLYKTRIWM